MGTQNIDFVMIRRFFSYYKPYKFLFSIDFSCAVLAALLELTFPLFVNHVVDKLLPSGNWTLIVTAFLVMLAVYALNTFLHFVVTYWGHILGINIETDMRSELFAHLQKLSFRFFDNNKTGSLMTRISTDLFDIGELAHHGPEDVFIAVMTLLGAFGLMFYIHPQMAMLTFIMIPLLITLAVFCNKYMTRAARQMFSDVADFNARVEDNIGGIRVVQAFANEEFEKKLFAKNNERYRVTKILAYRIMGWGVSLSYMLMRSVSLFVMICGAWFIFQGNLSSGEFIGFLLLANVFVRPIEKINAVVEIYPKGLAGFRRYIELIDTEPEIADAPDAVEITSVEGNIEYRDVHFAYEDHAKVLSGIDLRIYPGETIAFVGPSGAGKTTLCSLLPRFYDVQQGSITIDGVDIRQMTLQSLRRQIGIVQQDVFLFSGTIRENIVYGKLDATEEEIWEAVRRAHLLEFLQSQPDGLDTVIGDRGVRLSGGQKQRLAIARMFLKNPPILILDEATSALDTETELVIQRSLSELAQGRTTLVIAHRLATIKNADRIVVINEEGIVEEGSHQELLEYGGVYSRLHDAQFGEELREFAEIG